MTYEVLNRFKNNPNGQLHIVQGDIQQIKNKIEPILERVERAAEYVQKTQSLGGG